jgi:NAD(P)-dependent dehydrogenase (short-subunit alcohol dehydrogenase family)
MEATGSSEMLVTFYQATRHLVSVVRAGGRVILACRDLKRASDAADDIRRQTSGVEGAGEVLVVHLDLASFASVRDCAQNLLRTEKNIHVLINNAGESQHGQDSIPGNGN